VSPAKKSVKKSVKPPKSPYYEVRRSKIQGRGAFAILPIRKGKKIDEYWGQPITHDEADRRYDDSKGRHHTFLFVLDDDTVLDARYGGNDARFINHSCDPNCETVIEDGHIWIKAIKPITPDTELVYDYRFEWQDEYEPEDVRYYACRCGTKKCRGTILRIPVYLRPTIKRWLAGDDVPLPKKPRKGAKKALKKVVKTGTKKATKKATKKVVKKAVR
jgi:SET domain-containing protein